LGYSNQWSSITKKTYDLHNVKLGMGFNKSKDWRKYNFLNRFPNLQNKLEEKQIEYSFEAISPAANVVIKDVEHQKDHDLAL
jgi:hypothetical protein